MNKVRMPILLAALAFLFAGCSATPEATDSTGSVEQSLLSGPIPYRGVNLSSAEWGADPGGTGAVPGTHGTHYIYPDPAYANGYNSADYFIAKGMTTFRLPFRWERLQPARLQPFNAAELTRLRTTVSRLTSKGAQVMIDPHNYARYGTSLIGSSSVPNSDFADLWTRLANEFKGNTNVLFNLMNEPYEISTEQWVNAANAAISAIRATGAKNLILVPGNAWTGAHSWNQNWYGTSNAVAMLKITDPLNNYAFDVHQYLDANSSGTEHSCVSGSIGSDRMREFTAWARSHGKKAFLGEFGGGTSQTCLTAIDNLLSYLEQNSDVYIGWAFWAAGPWWGNIEYSLEPRNGVDRPQMTALTKHLGKPVTAPPAQPSTPPSSPNPSPPLMQPSSGCQATPYEAETMYNTTGGATTGGWNLWANGSVWTNASFEAGQNSLRVLAKGDAAAGAWPTMKVSVGGIVIGSASVTSSTWAEYAFSYTASAAGLKELRVSFDNDYFAYGEDRNLHVDKVLVGCPGTCQTRTYEAENASKSVGAATSEGWNLYANGHVSANHVFSGSGTQTITVVAAGDFGGGAWPRMVVTVGGVFVGQASVTSSSFAKYSFNFTTSAGSKEARIAFDNDYYANGEDRNLKLDKFTVSCAAN